MRSSVKTKTKKATCFVGGKNPKRVNSGGNNNNPPDELVQSAKNYGSSEAASSRSSHQKKKTFTSQLFSRLLKMTTTKKCFYILPTTATQTWLYFCFFACSSSRNKVEREKYLRKESMLSSMAHRKKAFNILSIMDF